MNEWNESNGDLAGNTCGAICKHAQSKLLRVFLIFELPIKRQLKLPQIGVQFS